MRKRFKIICFCLILILEQIIPINVQAADVVSVMSVADELRYEADGIIYEYNEETQNYEVSKCDINIRQAIIPDSIRGIKVTKNTRPCFCRM